MRKDWQNLAPAHGLNALVENGTIENLEVKDHVANILETNGVDLNDVEGVIWSHWYVRIDPPTRLLLLTVVLEGISTTLVTRLHSLLRRN